MRNDLYEMRKDPARKKDADKLLEGRGSAHKITKLDQQKWHHAIIELKGDAIRVSLDGKPVAFLKSPGIAHETKSSFHFTVSGTGALFDDVCIWQAK